jgi:hypothetical protein
MRNSATANVTRSPNRPKRAVLLLQAATFVHHTRVRADEINTFQINLLTKT